MARGSLYPGSQVLAWGCCLDTLALLGGGQHGGRAWLWQCSLHMLRSLWDEGNEQQRVGPCSLRLSSWAAGSRALVMEEGLVGIRPAGCVQDLDRATPGVFP